MNLRVSETAATMSPLLLTLSGAGRVLGVSEATVSRMVRRGDLPQLRFGGLVRVPNDELGRWMACIAGTNLR